jgi:HlyD family secretion protein
MNKTTKWLIAGSVVLTVTMIVLSKTGVIGEKKSTRVTAEKVQRRTIVEVVNASGKIYPEIEVKISPDISGEITELYVQEGDTVKKGQLLARIYADIYSLQRDQAAFGVEQSRSQVANVQATLDALEAQLDQSRKAFEMQQQLFKDNVISKNEFNVAEGAFKTAKANYQAGIQSVKGGSATVRSAEASLRRADKDLGRTALLAPIDGVVTLLNVKKGEKVAGNSFNIGTEILRIANMDKIEVRVDVGENDIPKVKLGDSAVVTVDAYSDRTFRGVVTQIASSNTGASANALTGGSTDVTQYKVYVRLIPYSYQDLLGKGSFPFRPGMSASVDIQTRTHANVLSVPINAVTTREKETGVSMAAATKDAEEEGENQSVLDLDVLVFVKGKDGLVRKKAVKTGIQDLNYMEIIDGLVSNEEVITGPYEVVSKELKDSMEVMVVDKKDLFEKSKKD